MSEIIKITKSAEEYLAKLIQDKNELDLSIRIFISDPGTPKAETCLAYCKPEEAMPDDLIINLARYSSADFVIFIISLIVLCG